MAFDSPSPYPIGTPGTPWGAAEKATWLGRQRVQRSYAQEVLAPLRAALPAQADLWPDDKQLSHRRIINFTSHSTLSNEVVAVTTPVEQATVKLLTDHLKSRHAFWQLQGA